VIAVEFDQEYAQAVLDALASGEPIPTHDGTLRVFDMLSIAGACMFAAMTHGPTLTQPDLNAEQRAERDRAFMDDVLGAIEFLAEQHMRVLDGEFESGPVLKGLIDAKAGKFIPRPSG
jgi:hypothetical protein